LIDALDVPLPNGPLDIRQRALAQADLVEPIERAGKNLAKQHFAAPAKFDFATSRNTANIYSINRPPQMTFHLGNVD
jgi:hypothetical protein